MIASEAHEEIVKYIQDKTNPEILKKRKEAQARWAKKAKKREEEEKQRRVRRHLTKKNSKKKRDRYPYYDNKLVLEKEISKSEQLMKDKLSALKAFTTWINRKSNNLLEQDSKRFMAWLRAQISCSTFDELNMESCI